MAKQTTKIPNNQEQTPQANNKRDDRVDHPAYYNRLPFETIELTKHFSFTLGSALKYIVRAGFKSEEGMSQKQKTIEDLKKARWYLDYEIKELTKENI